MSMSMTKGGGVTTVTITSNPKSGWPPLCQVLGALCYSPLCCSGSEKLSADGVTSQSVLGALQIMVGCLNIGLGAILACSSAGLYYTVGLYNVMALDLLYPYVLGGVFIGIGILCILTKKFPSPRMMFVNVLVNLAGIAAATTAIVLYTIYLPHEDSLWSLCDANDQHCMEAKATIIVLAQGVTAVLIIVSVLQLCVNVSSAVLGIKALRRHSNHVNKDPEQYKTLEEDTTHPMK